MRIGVLASGGGTNLEAILRAGLPVVTVVVDRPCGAAAVAEAAGVPVYLRAPTVSVADAFIGGLADTVLAALARAPGVETAAGGRRCEACWTRCPARAA